MGSLYQARISVRTPNFAVSNQGESVLLRAQHMRAPIHKPCTVGWAKAITEGHRRTRDAWPSNKFFGIGAHIGARLRVYEAVGKKLAYGFLATKIGRRSPHGLVRVGDVGQAKRLSVRRAAVTNLTSPAESVKCTDTTICPSLPMESAM